MLLNKKSIRVGKRGKKTLMFLMQCETCSKIEWKVGKNCKYGKNKFCSGKCANSGEHNGFYGKKHTKETLSKIKLFDVNTWNNIRKNMNDEEYNIWYSKFCENRTGENNPFYGKKHTKEAREKMSETRSKLIADGYLDMTPAHYGLKGHYYSTKMNIIFRYDSFIEYLRMKMLDIDNDVLQWTKKHGLRIKYDFDGYKKSYIPDFLVTYSDKIVLEELKGYEENERKKQIKFIILKKYCDENNIIARIILCDEIDDMCRIIFGRCLRTLRDQYNKDYKNKEQNV